MPKWIWWLLGGIAVLMIWRGQGALLGHDIGCGRERTHRGYPLAASTSSESAKVKR